MLQKIIRNIRIFLFNKKKGEEIFPDEIFLDSHNLPAFDVYQMEGRLEKPISRFAIISTGIFLSFVGLIIIARLWHLEVNRGNALVLQSNRNTLYHEVLLPKRAVIRDRNGEILAWNGAGANEELYERNYTSREGLSHIIGFVKNPAKDNNGYFYVKEMTGQSGAEKTFQNTLQGKNGVQIVEIDVNGTPVSESILEKPVDGENVTLSIDAALNENLYESIAAVAKAHDYSGGAGVMIDVLTGEIVAMTSYPEYKSLIMTRGKDFEAIENFLGDKRKPFLNRALSGLYSPGSTVKPFLALGILNEGLIDPNKKILSTGSIEVPNPYDPAKKNVFKDWKAHGLVNMRQAIAVSSDIYFYETAGGFEDQKGLGISGIERYMRMFGFGSTVEGNYFFKGEEGVIPNPKWKTETFNGDIWRIGDTYNTAIGQYGFQVTPLQLALGTAMIANSGTLLITRITKNEEGVKGEGRQVPIESKYFDIVKEGMRLTVTGGTAQPLGLLPVETAAKTGTAEVGMSRQKINSWLTLFFPYESPRYALTVIMERGPSTNQIGATTAVKNFLEWIAANIPRYLESPFAPLTLDQSGVR